jgi:uncharacterized protein YeeX (DUF496 family)
VTSTCLIKKTFDRNNNQIRPARNNNNKIQDNLKRLLVVRA